MAWKSSILDIIGEKTSMLTYNSAKITATPYDYNLSERVMYYATQEVHDYFNIFDKANDTEQEICKLLGLSWDNTYLALNPSLKFDTFMGYQQKDFEAQCDSDKSIGSFGIFTKYNNLKIDEQSLLKDIMGATGYIDPTVSSNVKALIGKGYLKALEVLYLKTTSSDSLTPNLMYLATCFYDRPLEYLENIEFAKDAMKSNRAPIVPNRYMYSDEHDNVKSNIFLAGAVMPVKFTKQTEKWYPLSSWMKYPFVSDNDIYYIGLCYSIFYGVELLYQLHTITDEDIKNSLEDLLAIAWEKDTFCDTYLYKIDNDGHVIPTDMVLACFDKNPEKRFALIKEFFEAWITFPHPDIMHDFNHFALPTIFAKMIMSMHAYAFQVCRIKHATLVYKEAKDKGVLTKKAMTSLLDTADSADEICGTTPDYVDNNQLLDLDFADYDSSSTEDFAKKEKEVKDKTSSTSPMLDTMSQLKKDLADSPYRYDINYVKHDVSDKDAYNIISNNVSLISHELTKQIKEIKTYNTGGKQNGLTVGKLDKKNLWKYRSDPHIFYNNNYKLKEMDLAFGCVLDESGSMSGENIKNGRIVMVMLHEVLTSLGINHSIIGHTAHGMYTSTIYKYYQFKEEAHYSLAKPYGLVKASARSGNCDSGALYYMESVMKHVKNKDKIVIIFSDGEPTECTDADLTTQVKRMEKNGIHVIGVGINFDSIKEYYPDNANGKNLKDMTNIVVSILKRYVLEKKED